MAVIGAACLLAVGCSATPPVPPRRPTLGSYVAIGVKNDQPGTGWENGYVRSGFDIDLANYVATALNVQPTFVDVPSSSRDTDLQNRTVQLIIATYSMTPDREQFAEFAGPYMRMSQGVLIRASDKQRIQQPGDLAGKQVCTAQGTTSEDVLNTMKDVHVTVLPEFADCAKSLEAGQFDAMSTDQIVLYGYTQQYPDLYVVPGIRLGSLNYYGVALPKNYNTDCEKIVMALKNYLIRQWAQDFRNELPAAVAADPNWETDFRPDPATLDAYSCK